MANECTLWVNGMIYGGWTAIRINRGIEQLAGSFTLSVTEKWPGQAEARPIKKGDSAVVKIDGEAVCTGYINRTRIGFDSGRTWFEVEGRDKTADLVDCSAVWKSGQWKGSSVQPTSAALSALWWWWAGWRPKQRRKISPHSHWKTAKRCKTRWSGSCA